MPTLFEEQAEGGDLADELRRAVAAADFDYAALASGVRRRVSRGRRRRALMTGVGVALLAPILVGGGALVVPSLLPSGIPTAAPPAAPTQAVAPPAAPVAPEESRGVEAGAARTVAAQRPPEPSTAPWQDTAPPLPQGGISPASADLPNAWAIPDARPTGVAGLDALGPPVYAADSPWIVPVDSLMSCDPARTGGVLPVAGQSFAYSADGLSLSIQVTGWEDSVAARDGLATDRYTLCTWDGAPGEPLPWEGREGDADYLLLVPEGADRGAAVVRQGDYVVAVTSPDTGDGSLRLAAEIAAKTAANLEALDPEHGRG